MSRESEERKEGDEKEGRGVQAHPTRVGGGDQGVESGEDGGQDRKVGAGVAEGELFVIESEKVK